jgi:hypothetical protein
VVETDSPPAALLPVINLARAGIYPDLWLEPWLQDKDLARSAMGLGGHGDSLASKRKASDSSVGDRERSEVRSRGGHSALTYPSQEGAASQECGVPQGCIGESWRFDPVRIHGLKDAAPMRP